MLTTTQILARDDIPDQAKATVGAMQDTMDQFALAWTSGKSPDTLRVLARLIANFADDLSVAVAKAPAFSGKIAS